MTICSYVLYKGGTYTVMVTAYNSDGESVSDEFVYVY